ncbi:unnamed protein product [Linum trigynum]|uniref:Amine oxidase domain-containing protein n=1 Tax=Linum trigynum TaxID=586398 RepID=A0AAV2D728_9ROSI
MTTLTLPSITLLLFLLPHLLSVSATAPASQSPSVIIVGAGMSGISAAKTLHDAGMKDILILEATSKVGGRMRKAEIGGNTVELGANWYQGGGPVPNPVLEIASKLNLRYTVTDTGNITANTYKQRGGLYPKEIVEEAHNASVGRTNFCSDFSETLNSDAVDEDDISILAAHRLLGKLPATPLERAVDYLNDELADGEPPQVTSLKNVYPRREGIDHGPVAHFVADPRGYEVVPQYLGKQFLSSLTNDPRLQFNKVVREISYTDSGVEVKTEDGSSYQAKFVIVSASIGVLQSDLIEFKPKLPMWKRLAIADFSMAVYSKIFLKFPYKFWPTGPGTEFSLYTHTQRGYYPVWQHLENEYPGSNMLMVTVTYNEAKRMEQLSDEEIQAEAMDVLRDMFGEHIPEPESMLTHRWWSDRFFKGSHSNWPHGYSQERHNKLGASVGPIYFTGEHIHKNYFGWVTGAYLAGIDTAKDLVKQLGKANRGVSDA